MPIYEFYCRDNNKIYSFFARSLRFANLIPLCPENSTFQMERTVSRFAVSMGAKNGSEESLPGQGQGGMDDARLEAAMQAVEGEFASMGNQASEDPRVLGKMMRRMSEVTGEKVDGTMSEMIRRIEAGEDPESIDSTLDVLETTKTLSYFSPSKAKVLENEANRVPLVPQRDPILYEFP